MRAAEADSGLSPIRWPKCGLRFDCPSCAHQWKSASTSPAFVWAEIEARARRLLLEVHTLASAYGWSESRDPFAQRRRAAQFTSRWCRHERLSCSGWSSGGAAGARLCTRFAGSMLCIPPSEISRARLPRPKTIVVELPGLDPTVGVNVQTRGRVRTSHADTSLSGTRGPDGVRIATRVAIAPAARA